MQQPTKIKRFTDLHTWQSSRQLVKSIYKLTEPFPASEIYGLVSQMKRAVISVSSNIAEGFRRSGMADKTHFYVMAHASLTELQNQLILSHDLAFIDTDTSKNVLDQTYEVDKLLSGLIRASRTRA